MTLLIWQCSKDSDSPLQEPCCFYFILYSYFIVVVSFFSNVFKGMYKVNILCIHSLICPLLYFKLKYIQSSPSLVESVESASPGSWMKKTSEYFHQVCIIESSPGSYSCPCVSCPCPCLTSSYRTSVLHMGLTPFTGLKSCEPCHCLCKFL